MITARLEDLVLRGFAKVKNYSGGYSALYTIPCPDGSFIVVVSISVMPGLPISDDAGDLVLNVCNQLGGNDIFIFRPENQDRAGNRTTGQFINYDTYIVSNEDIRLRFSEIRPGSYGSTYAPATEETKEAIPPQGYFGVNFVSVVDMGAGARTYKPIGQKYSVALGPGSIDQPDVGVEVGISELDDAGAPWDGLLLNCQYVVINRAWADFIAGK